jgi:hypothetical protein
LSALPQDRLLERPEPRGTQEWQDLPVAITDYRKLFSLVARRPLMYLIRDDFPTVVAFVEGCDQGNAGGLLAGFREWLITRLGYGNNLTWWALVLLVAEPGMDDSPHPDPQTPEADARARQTLYALLDEFLALTAEHGGRRRIHAAHQTWLTAHDAAIRDAIDRSSDVAPT